MYVIIVTSPGDVAAIHFDFLKKKKKKQDSYRNKIFPGDAGILRIYYDTVYVVYDVSFSIINLLLLLIFLGQGPFFFSLFHLGWRP